MNRILILSLLLIALVFSAKAQNSKKEAKEKLKQDQYQQVIDLIDSENYEFIGRKAYPQKGPQIDLTTNPNFMRIENKNASADMPYFGRAFNVGYSGSDGGIKFDGPMESYDIQRNDKKRRLTIKYKVKGADDNYTCTLTISGLQSASLSVSSNKRQVISYNGFVKTISEE